MVMTNGKSYQRKSAHRLAAIGAGYAVLTAVLSILFWGVRPLDAGIVQEKETHAPAAGSVAHAKEGAVAAEENVHAGAVGETEHAGHDEHANISNFDYHLGTEHLLHHTADKSYFEIPSLRFDAEDSSRKIWIPRLSPWTDEAPLMKQPAGKAGEFLGPITFQPSKFILLELLAALIVAGMVLWLAGKVRSGQPPRGRFWNMLEAIVVYVRDQVARPAIGSHDYKNYLPFLLTVFFFVLTMNLMGMFPLLGTPTGNISITASLALCVFALVLFSGMKKLGVVGFWKAQVPHLGVKGPFGIVLNIGIWCIEVFGLFIKHMVLAVRLFANMFAGHMVLAVIVGFIGAFWGLAIAWLVVPGSIGGSVALSLLEVLVAFIQAYVFTFLTALFIGAALHPH
jgi:F-type H+-transporting ATPase subunit a